MKDNARETGFGQQTVISDKMGKAGTEAKIPCFRPWVSLNHSILKN